jgi:hypothetical protein
MAIETERVPRSWADLLLPWRHAYETRVFDEAREAVGRGPTYEASREAALEKWVDQWQREHNARLD